MSNKRKIVDSASEISNDLLPVLNEFRENIILFNINLKIYKDSLEKPQEYIDKECEKIKALVELEAGIISKNMGNALDDLLDPELNKQQYQELIIRIENFGKEAKSFWNNKRPNKQINIREYNKLQQFSEFFLQKWDDRLNDFNYDENTIKKAAEKLNEYEIKLKYLTETNKRYMFNNKCIELNRKKLKQENEICLNKRVEIKQRSVLENLDYFKGDTLIFNKKLINYKKILDSPEEYIYNECEELKREVQLETEKSIAKIKKSNSIDINTEDDLLDPNLFALVDEIKQYSLTLITEIETNEKKAKSHCFDKKFNYEEYNKLKKFSDAFNKIWNDCLNELNFDYNERMKLVKHEDLLDDLVKEKKNFIFNNNRMKSQGFNVSERNIFNCYIYYDQVINLEDSCFRIGANEIINNSSISAVYNKKMKLPIRYFDILDNGLYFVIFTDTCSSFIAKYDPCLKNIKKEKLFEFCWFQGAFINQNLCASINKIVTSNRAVPKFCLVILNEDLEIIKQMQDVDLIRCTNNLFIYASNKNEPDIIHILNWSLEKIKTIKFQDDPEKEFHLRDSTYSGSRFENFKVLEDNCYLVNSSKYISIFDENGILLKNFSLESRSFNNICLIQNENLILLKNKNYSDYNPCLFCADFNGKTKKIIQYVVKPKEELYIEIKSRSNGKLYYHHLINQTIFWD